MTELAEYTIKEISPLNIDKVVELRMESWLDTYVNDELGITREWITEFNKKQSSEAARRHTLEKLASPNTAGWVVEGKNGKVLGVATPYVDSAGVQHVGSLYVDKEWHGKGVAGALMQKIIDWCDNTKPIILGVAIYNERAKAFYRKWGFVEIPHSEKLFDNKIPEIMMSRPPEKF